MSRDNIILFEETEVDAEKFIVTLSSPAYWKNDGVRNKFKYVYAPSYPEIEKAYSDAGKEIYRPSGEKPPETEPEPTPEPEPTIESDESDVVNDSEDEGDAPHWSELSWPQMRSKASEFTDEPIKSKSQAQDILKEAEENGKI